MFFIGVGVKLLLGRELLWDDEAFVVCSGVVLEAQGEVQAVLTASSL